MQDELFTTTELKSFGTYLLSRERSESIFNSTGEGDFLQMLAQVHHADFENWKALHGEAGVAITEPDVVFVEKTKFCSLCDEAWAGTLDWFDHAKKQREKEGPSQQPGVQASVSPTEMLAQITAISEMPSPLAGISFKAKGNTGGESEGPSPQPEKPRTVVLVDTPLVL